MSIIILALLSLEKIRLVGAWWIILAHGLVSSGIFAGANIIYEQRHSRRLILNKGTLANSPAFTLFWFRLLIINFRGPLTLNLFSEIKLILGALSISVWILIPIAILTFFAAAYCLILYARSQQGHTASNIITAINTTPRELRILWRHRWPIFVLLLNLRI
jgi:NADH-quinone oxidoreductase subunit M